MQLSRVIVARCSEARYRENNRKNNRILRILASITTLVPRPARSASRRAHFVNSARSRQLKSRCINTSLCLSYSRQIINPLRSLRRVSSGTRTVFRFSKRCDNEGIAEKRLESSSCCRVVSAAASAARSVRHVLREGYKTVCRFFTTLPSGDGAIIEREREARRRNRME